VFFSTVTKFYATQALSLLSLESVCFEK